jgi:hypothetical protein
VTLLPADLQSYTALPAPASKPDADAVIRSCAAVEPALEAAWKRGDGDVAREALDGATALEVYAARVLKSGEAAEAAGRVKVIAGRDYGEHDRREFHPGRRTDLSTPGTQVPPVPAKTRRITRALAETDDDGTPIVPRHEFVEALAAMPEKTYAEAKKFVAKVKREKRQTAHANTDVGDLDIRRGDFREVLTDIPDASVDLILTDPPYGFDYVPLYGDMAEFAARVLKPDGSVICFTGQSILPDVYDQLRPHLRYWWTFALSHGKGQQLPGKFVVIEWKPVVWFVRERRRDDHVYVADRIRGTGALKDRHPWAQGTEELVYVIEQLTDPGNVIVDPFAGGGGFGETATRLHRNFIGADLERGRSDV